MKSIKEKYSCEGKKYPWEEEMEEAIGFAVEAGRIALEKVRTRRKKTLSPEESAYLTAYLIRCENDRVINENRSVSKELAQTIKEGFEKLSKEYKNQTDRLIEVYTTQTDRVLDGQGKLLEVYKSSTDRITEGQNKLLEVYRSSTDRITEGQGRILDGIKKICTKVNYTNSKIDDLLEKREEKGGK